MWRGLSLKRYVGRDYKVHAMSADRSTEASAQLPRSSRAQSILQTETSVLWDLVFTEVLFNTAGTKALGCFTVVLLTLWLMKLIFFSFYILIYEEAEENVAFIEKPCKVDNNVIAEHLKPIILVNIVA